MIQLQNYYRQIIAVVLLVGLGLLAYQARELFTGPQTPPQAQPFSPVREKADESYMRQDWSRAEQNYRSMTERDPYNGYAWYSLGDSIWRQARRQLSERDRLARALVPDSARMDELNIQIKELGDKAVECFLHAQDTGRFRIIAGQRIAEIYSVQGEKRKAIEMLDKCYDDGMTLRGLKTIAEFVPLHNDPEFEELAKREPRSSLRNTGTVPVPAIGGRSEGKNELTPAR
jgi:tetratricopeptide (TPR) repeat protein